MARLQPNNWGLAKLVKAPDFDSGMRRFESFIPSQISQVTVPVQYKAVALYSITEAVNGFIFSYLSSMSRYHGT